MKKFRVFISSPGDVAIERNAAKKILSDIEKAYSDSIKIEVLMWEDMPLDATSTFQAGIDYFINQEPIDIAIFIVWRKIGSELGESFVKPDGTQYTGTEYEFEVMRQMRSKKKCPQILFYQKTSSCQVDYENIIETAKQKMALDAFFKNYFTNEATGENYARFQFDKTKEFAHQLSAHLMAIIAKVMGDAPLIQWEGNPYQGLQYFDSDHHPIFYGRGDVVEELSRSMLSDSRNVILLGGSGTGKTSLVCAGIVPVVRNVKENEGSQVRFVRITPSQFGVDIVNQVKHVFQNNDIVFFDQFEELFSSPQLDKETRKEVVDFLYNNRENNRFILSMRNDFYTFFSEYPVFGELKNECLVKDIPPMTRTEMLEIIEQPAKMAGVQWEVRKGKSLSKTILDDAISLGNLPLTEFVLTDLFEHRDSNGLLTFEEYERMGMVKGAVVHYADKVFNSLSDEEQRAFFDLLGLIVKVMKKGRNRSEVRIPQLYDTLCGSDSVRKRVVDKLIKARLFVSDKDGEGRAVVTIVHEELLRSWDVIKQWIDQNDSILEQRDRIEDRATHWRQSEGDRRRLLRDTLNEVEFFKMKYGHMLSEESKRYIDVSLEYDGRGSRLFNSILMIIIMGSSIVGVAFPRLVYFQEYGLPKSIMLTTFYAVSFLVALADMLLLGNRPNSKKNSARRLVLWSLVFVLSCYANLYGLKSYSPNGVKDVWFSYFPHMFYLGEMLFPFIVLWQAILDYVKYTTFLKLEDTSAHQRFFKRMEKAKHFLTTISMVSVLAIFFYGTVVVPKNYRLKRENKWRDCAAEIYRRYADLCKKTNVNIDANDINKSDLIFTILFYKDDEDPVLQKLDTLENRTCDSIKKNM